MGVCAECHTTYEWRCGSGECIPVYDVCTGIAQCVDGSDEGADMCRRRLENIQAVRAKTYPAPTHVPLMRKIAWWNLRAAEKAKQPPPPAAAAMPASQG